jgi:4-diphosphocytidyl-2-C-methyl-D-erythritol kinase
MICEVKAYAKINLGLKILRRDRNGYHKLQSIMSLIDLHDDIMFEESDKIEVITTPYVCDEKTNLCYRVAEYMKKYTNGNKGIRIIVNKRIPVGGGLGGGSSNAAAVMLFLNDYWDINFSRKKMMKIAFSFGADIPFFINGEQSFVYGYGEKMKPLKKKRAGDIVLVIPPFSLNTKKVFMNFDKMNMNKKNVKSVYSENIFNDLEESANDISNNQIAQIKATIKKVGSGEVFMSGSGSTIVYYVAEGEDSKKVSEQIKEKLNGAKVILSKIKTN